MPSSAVTSDVSVVAPCWKSSPSCAMEAARARNSSVFVRFPLWARATVPSGVGPSVGWAFSHTSAPVVA